MTSDKTATLVPVESDENIRAVRELRKLLQSSMGPSGSSKLFVTGGGITQLVSTSSALLDRLELENPICRCIAQVSKSFPDYGLYFGVLVSHLLEQQWINESVPKPKLMQTISSIAEKLHELLASELVCRKVDFSSINSFLPLVRTVVSSKCSTLSADLDVNKLSVEVVKLFLNCVDEVTNTVGRIYIKVESGTNHISSHNGLLYQIVKDHDLEIIKKFSGGAKLLLFTCKLEPHNDKSSFKQNKTIQILEQAIELNVQIIACQKTISAEVRLYLMRRNIVLLDRMGTDLTAELVQMSRAFPISQIDFGMLDLPRLVGELTSVRHVQFNDSDYVLLQNDKMSVGTLLVLNTSLAEVEHLKVLARQAVGALRSLVARPFLTFGGGCLEVWLVAQLVSMKNKTKKLTLERKTAYLSQTHFLKVLDSWLRKVLKENQTDKDFSTISNWIQKALLSACGPSPPEAIDSAYHHGWDEEDGTQCRCGFVTRKQLEQVHGQLIYLCEVTNSCSKLNLKPANQPSTCLHAEVLVDSHEQKTNVIVTALETFVNLSDIGLILYEN